MAKTPQRRRHYTLPTKSQIDAIGLVPIDEYELSEKETRQLRIELYKINKDGIRKYRTMRENGVVLVWRIK